MPGRDLEAEQLLADTTDAGSVTDAESAERAREPDVLDILDGMSSHYHEHHEALLRWSWKLFCAKWARWLTWAYADEDRRAEQERERQLAELRASQR